MVSPQMYRMYFQVHTTNYFATVYFLATNFDVKMKACRNLHAFTFLYNGLMLICT